MYIYSLGSSTKYLTNRFITQIPEFKFKLHNNVRIFLSSGHN